MTSLSFALYREGQHAWPTISLDEERFARAAGAHAASSAHAADVFLACAAAHGIPAAVAIFEREHMSRVPRFVAHMSLPAHAIDELCQRLREQLLVPRDGRPTRLIAYRGSGPLDGWLCVVAVRAALDLLRSERNGPPLGADALDELSHVSPELEILRARYLPRFREALDAGVAALTPRERSILRLSLVEGLTLDKMAQQFQVTKSTVHRWLMDAQQRLMRQVRRTLQTRLGLNAHELESVARQLRSHVEINLPSLLRTR